LIINLLSFKLNVILWLLIVNIPNKHNMLLRCCTAFEESEKHLYKILIIFDVNLYSKLKGS